MSAGSLLPFNRTLCAGWLILIATASLFADSQDSSKPVSESAPKILQGYRLQEWEDLALPLVPKNALTPAGQMRNEAVAWFMAGRLLEARNEPRRAVTAYRKAVALDPNAIEIYRSLVPLEFQLDEVEAAVKSASKAVELDPAEYELLHMLASHAALTGKLPEAIRHLELAVKSPRVNKQSLENVMLHKSLGTLYTITGQPDKAADSFEVVFDALVTPEKYKLDPRAKSRLLADPQISFERIGQVFIDAKRIKLAEKAFDQAAKGGKVGIGNLSYNRARILLLSDKPEEALAELQKYLDAQRTSKGRDAYQLLADILEKLKRSDELIARLEALAAKDENNLHLQFFLASQLFDADELEKAREIYEAALPQGADAVGYVGLARVLRKMKRPGDLLDLFHRAMNKLGPEGLVAIEAELKKIAEDAQTVDLMIAAGRDQAKADPPQLTFEKAIILAGLAKNLDRIDDAVEFYKAAITMRKEQNVPLYTELGNMLIRAHRYAAAEELFTDALKERRMTSERADLLGMLARSQVLNGKLKESLESIEESLKLEPGDVGHLFDEAWIYSHSRQFDEAISRFEKLRDMTADRKPLQRICLFTLSSVFVQKGEFRKGEEILEKILEADPDDTQVNNDLGYLWADQGKNLDRAEKMIRKAVEAEPDNGAYLDSLGWVLFKLGKYDEAVAPIEQAVKKNTGGDATLWDHLGDVQLKLKQVDKAVESWQRSLKSTDEDKFADTQLVERLKEKLKQHAPQANQPKPATPGSP